MGWSIGSTRWSGLEKETLAYAERVAENDPTVLRLSKLAINKAQDLQGYSVGVEGGVCRLPGDGVSEG